MNTDELIAFLCEKGTPEKVTRGNDHSAFYTSEARWRDGTVYNCRVEMIIPLSMNSPRKRTVWINNKIVLEDVIYD